ncbi:hypothetical protein TRVA0_057S00122 [Trichomonascus vanleenenianus]|uniref:uncharacterized protein n=1 Tax=Trichomonascus vanleenenianus TaxID=2268995 RepID=UPI003ECA06B3
MAHSTTISETATNDHRSTSPLPASCHLLLWSLQSTEIAGYNMIYLSTNCALCRSHADRIGHRYLNCPIALRLWSYASTMWSDPITIDQTVGVLISRPEDGMRAAKVIYALDIFHRAFRYHIATPPGEHQDAMEQFLQRLLGRTHDLHLHDFKRMVEGWMNHDERTTAKEPTEL